MANTGKENTIKGKEWLVGAGPNDPGLMTVKGKTVLEQAEVAILHVAAIRPQMHGDAMGAGALGDQAGSHRLGLMPAPSLPQGGHMIDVHA